MIIAGIDVSTKTGLAVLHFGGKEFCGDILHKQKVEAKKMTGFERCARIGATVSDVINHWKPDLVVLEDYGFSFRGSTIILVELGTVVRYFLWQENHRCMNVEPTTLKKFVTGSGAAKKDAMIESINTLWGHDEPDNDIADAIALAYFGACVAGFEVGVPEANLSVFKPKKPKKKK